MAWYRNCTVSVTNGSAVVTGAGTDFVANVSAGDAFIGPDVRLYEVAAVVSATQLTLVGNYNGGTAGGQPYMIQPTQSYIRDLALGAAALLNTFGAVRDGIGQGLIADGSAAAPGLRFSADQDTGIRRVAGNGFSLVTGGTDRLVVTTGGLTAYGSAEIVANEFPSFAISRQGVGTWFVGGSGVAGDNSFGVRLNGDAPALRIDTGGNLLVGVAASAGYGGANRIAKGVAQGGPILGIDGAFFGQTALFFSVAANGYSGAPTAMLIGRNDTTNRSINAGGTINASGADYAEYMTKCDGCGTIAPGDVCGVTKDGKLTRTFADAVSFIVKSTDPAYVGADTWAVKLPPRPDQRDNETDDAFAKRLSSWEAALEVERQKVDRIAFTGQTPVTVSGSFAPGDYIIAAANGTGIKAVAVGALLITFEQYRRRIGKVWRAIDAGHAWIDVQHG